MTPKTMVKLGGAFFAAIAFLSVAFGSFYTVDETERGVLLRNGALVSTVDPGLSFKMPFIESVKFITVQSQSTVYTRLQAYSMDQQTATLNVSVSWRIPASEVARVYTQYQTVEGMVERLLSRHVPTQAENVFGRYTAVRVVQNRAEFVSDLAKAIKEAADGPLIIDGVQVENIDFSDAYERSVEDRMRAEVEVQTQKQNLEKERVNADIAVTKAQAEADSQLARAKAEAEGIRIKGEAEASAIKSRADALAKNQDLVNLIKAERWDGKLPQTMLPNSAIPFIDVK